MQGSARLLGSHTDLVPNLVFTHWWVFKSVTLDRSPESSAFWFLKSAQSPWDQTTRVHGTEPKNF